MTANNIRIWEDLFTSRRNFFFFYLKTFRKLFPAPILDAIPLQLFCEHKEGDLSPGKGVLLKSPQYLRK